MMNHLLQPEEEDSLPKDLPPLHKARSQLQELQANHQRQGVEAVVRVAAVARAKNLPTSNA